MKINDIINEDADRDARYVRQFQQKKIERELRSLAGKLKGALQSVSVQFAGHFAERMIDDRNDPKITLDELEAFIRKIDASDEMQSNLAKAGAEGLQAVVHEIKSKLNVPFMIKLLPDGPDANDIPDLKLVPKTIMRKANFGTSGPKFNMEDVQAPLFKKALMQESGSMPGVGAIHISEIEPTLRKLEKELGIDLMNNALGSVGKRQFSGDMDVALELGPDQIPEFMERLEASPNILDMAKSSVIMTKVKIENYDEEKSDGRPRTGYVQLDFMPGNPEWLKTYYHSPREEDSKYKGAYRTILLAIIAAVHNQKNSGEMIDDHRYEQSERWKFSPAEGLVRVIRTPVPKKNGQGYTKKHIDDVIEGPYTNAETIAHNLNLGNADAMDSFETLLDAIQKNYPEHEVDEILADFVQNSKVQAMGVPDELSEWAPLVGAIARGLGTAAANAGTWAMRNPVTTGVVGAAMMSDDSTDE